MKRVIGHALIVLLLVSAFYNVAGATTHVCLRWRPCPKCRLPQKKKPRGVGAASVRRRIEPTFPGHKKMSLTLKRRWQQAMREGDLLVKIPCTVKLDRRVDKAAKRSLRGAGLAIESSLRTIVTGMIEIGELPSLVAIGEVKSVDGGKVLRPK